MCDVESYIYLPLLEELGYVPKEKYARAPEILAAQPGDRRSTTTSTAAPASRPKSPSCAGTRTTRAGSSSTNRGDRMRARFVCMANGPLHRPKLPGIPGIETFRGPLVPHQPLGLRLHRRRLQREPHRPARQARRHHRHRRDGGAVRAAPRRGGRAPLRVPAHAVVDRRARQPPHRSGVGGEPRAGLAPAPHGQLQHPGLRRLPGGGPGQRRLDRHHPQAAGDGAARDRAPSSPPSGMADTMELRGLREDGADPRARRRDRRTTRRRPRR